MTDTETAKIEAAAHRMAKRIGMEFVRDPEKVLPAPAATEMKACPHCGRRDKLKIAPYIADDDGGEPFDWGFTVLCSALGFTNNPNRGCGASGAWGETEAEAIEAWNRRTDALSASPMTDTETSDWVLVPREPTPEMLNAPLPDKAGVYAHPVFESRRDLRPTIYRTMLAAATKPLSASPKGDDLEPVAFDATNRADQIAMGIATLDGEKWVRLCDYEAAIQSLKAERDALRGALDAVRKRTKNARGAIESDQVLDKDVHGSLTWVLDTIDAALEPHNDH